MCEAQPWPIMLWPENAGRMGMSGTRRPGRAALLGSALRPPQRGPGRAQRAQAPEPPRRPQLPGGRPPHRAGPPRKGSSSSTGSSLRCMSPEDAAHLRHGWGRKAIAVEGSGDRLSAGQGGMSAGLHAIRLTLAACNAGATGRTAAEGVALAPEEETACGSEAEGLDIVLAASVVDGAELAGGGMIQHTYAMQLSLRGSRASV